MTLTRRHDPFSPHAKAAPDDDVEPDWGPAFRQAVEQAGADALERMRGLDEQARAELANQLDKTPADEVATVVEYWLADLASPMTPEQAAEQERWVVDGHGHTLHMPGQVGQTDPANLAVLEGTIPEVEAYVADHPGHAAELLDAERSGKARKTLVASLEHAVQAQQPPGS